MSQRVIMPMLKEFWMSDDSAKSCFKCDKPFGAFRRRHHCRYCGLIFCSRCSSKSTEISEEIFLERSCETCVQSIRRTCIMGRQDSVNSEERPVSPETKTQMRPHSREIRKILQELTEESFNEWDFLVRMFLREIVYEELQSLELDLEWVDLIFKVVIEAVHTVCPSVLFRDDKMDINNYIKIVKAESTRSASFVNGIILKKNLAHRRMSKTIDTPKILLLKSGIQEEDSKLISMDQLIYQENKSYGLLIKKLISISPNIVVSETALPANVLEVLSQKDISAIIKLKDQSLELLARAVNGKILENVDRVTTTISKCIGFCNKFRVEKHGNCNYSFFEHPKDPTLAGSIFVTGDKSETQEVASLIKRLLVTFKDAFIEKKLFQQFQITIEDNLMRKTYTKSLRFKKMAVFKNHFCLHPSRRNTTFYSQADIPLGQFMEKITQRAEIECRMNSKNSEHTNAEHIIYFCNELGKVKLQTKDSPRTVSCQEIIMKRKCKRCYDPQSNTVTLSNASWEYSFHKFISNFLTPESFRGKCEHDFFKDSVFDFYVASKMISVEFEANQIFSIATHQPEDQEHSKGYKEIAFKELQHFSKETLDDLLQHSRLILSSLRSEYRPGHDWELLKEQTLKINELVSSSILDISNLDISEFLGQFAIETYKRNLYFKVCDFKLSLEYIQLAMENLNNNEPFESCINFESKQSIALSHSEEEQYDGKYVFDYGKIRQIIDLSDDRFLQSPGFSYLKDGNFTLPLGIEGQCVPIDEYDSLSIIAYTLNSRAYHQSVVSTMPPSLLERIGETEILSVNSSDFVISFSTLEDFSEVAHRSFVKQLYGNNIKFKVVVKFPRQFQCIRFYTCWESFLPSIMKSLNETMKPGKKGYFKLSHDRQFIAKIVDEREFKMFLEFAPQYFKHFCKTNFHGFPSLLATPLGAFVVTVKNNHSGRSRTDYILIYRNLMYGLSKPLSIYDLKGTTNKKRYVKDGEGKTKMDRNFIEDFQGVPVFLMEKSKAMLEAAVLHDTLFLAENNIIDYSLFVCISKNEGIISAGIVDYIEQYTFEKAVEYKYKKYINQDNPTIIHSKLYSDRFIDRILNTYFLSFNN